MPEQNLSNLLTSARPSYLKQGELARLFPVLKESKREERATSIALSCLRAVGEFGRAVFAMTGLALGTRARITCFTEVVLNHPAFEGRIRPDGLIIIETGKNRIQYLVESKIGAEALDAAQVEGYLDAAKELGMDGVITISNQFTPLPTQHPLEIDGRKLRSVALFHWSWKSLMSQAQLLAQNKAVADPDQAFILTELIRFLEHENSGVRTFTSMGRSWGDLCAKATQGTPLARADPEVVDGVSSWHQLSSSLAIELSRTVGREVSLRLKRGHEKDPRQRFNEDVDRLVDSVRLESDFVVPDAASEIRLAADLNRRTLTASMRLVAPGDRVQAKSHVTWILGQLVKCEALDLVVRADWPGRAPSTTATLGALRQDKEALLQGAPSGVPVAFEVNMVQELESRFKGQQTFVDDALRLLPTFYEQVGQHMRAWVPPAPPVVKPVDATSAARVPELATGNVPVPVVAPASQAQGGNPDKPAPSSEGSPPSLS